MIDGNAMLAFAFSPDGKYLAYTRRADQSKVIILRNLINGEETSATLPASEQETIRVGDIHWSPSGSGLVFQTEEEGWMVQTFYLDIRSMHLQLLRRYMLYELFLEGWENASQVRFLKYPQQVILLMEPVSGQETILGTATP